MKTNVTINLIFVFLVLGLVSCDSDHSKWTNKLEISRKKLDLTAAEDSIYISINGASWWISNINSDGNYIYANTEDMNNRNTRIEGGWFTVEKKDNESVVVHVYENKSNIRRKMIITLESGNYFDYMNVSQEGKE